MDEFQEELERFVHGGQFLIGAWAHWHTDHFQRLGPKTARRLHQLLTAYLEQNEQQTQQPEPR
jgi:hypothetical protein